MTWRYMGPDQATGAFAEDRALQAGMSSARSRVLGEIGSFEDGWAPRKTIAKRIGRSLRTVQRGITQGKELCFLGVARFGKNETPPGAKGPITCGGSHRWTIGREGSGEARRAAVNKARLKKLLRSSFPSEPRRGEPHRVPHAPSPQRGLTPEQRKRLLELEAEERAELEAMAAAAIAASESRSRDGPGHHN